MDRLNCATRFEIMPEFYPAFGLVAGGISVERREQMDGSIKWIVTWGGHVLTKAGSWSYDPTPSSRTASHLSKTRFDTLDEAWGAALKVSRRALKAIVKKHGLAPYRNHHGQAIPFPVLPA